MKTLGLRLLMTYIGRLYVDRPKRPFKVRRKNKVSMFGFGNIVGFV